MATAFIIALTLGYEHTVYEGFIIIYRNRLNPITLYMSICLLPLFHVINNVVYVTIVE